MTIPRFLQSTFHFNQDLGVVDVSTIISSLTTILTTQAPAWTNPSAGVFISPVDSVGRFMKVVVARSSAVQMTWQVFDQNNILVANRSIEIDAAVNPTTVNYFSGQYHLYIETLVAPTPEWAGAFLIEPTGYVLQDLQNYVVGNAFRTSGGAIDGQGSIYDQWFMLESGSPTLRQRVRAVMTSPGLNVGLLDFSGDPQFFPFDVVGVPSGTIQWMGSLYQVYVTDSRVPAGIIKPVAIDNATAASFRTTVAGANGQLSRMAIRVT